MSFTVLEVVVFGSNVGLFTFQVSLSTFQRVSQKANTETTKMFQTKQDQTPRKPTKL